MKCDASLNVIKDVIKDEIKRKTDKQNNDKMV